MRKFEPDTAIIVMTVSVYSHMRVNRQCSVLEAIREAAQVLLNAAHLHYLDEGAAQQQRDPPVRQDRSATPAPGDTPTRRREEPAPQPTTSVGNDALLAQLDAQPRMFKDDNADLELFRAAAARIRALEKTAAEGAFRLHMPARYNAGAGRYELASETTPDTMMMAVDAVATK